MPAQRPGSKSPNRRAAQIPARRLDGRRSEVGPARPIGGCRVRADRRTRRCRGTACRVWQSVLRLDETRSHSKDDRASPGAVAAGVGRRRYRCLPLLRPLWRTDAECDDRHVCLHGHRTLPRAESGAPRRGRRPADVGGRSIPAARARRPSESAQGRLQPHRSRFQRRFAGRCCLH